LHTHVFLEGPPTHDLEHDRALVYAALREGRCYIANDQVADARGFAFWAEGGRNKSALTPFVTARNTPGQSSFVTAMGGEAAFAPGTTLHVRVPQPAHIRLLRDGAVVAETGAAELDHSIELPGVYRVEVALGDRPWIYSNPVYLRAYS
jgi:hypothetical protein